MDARPARDALPIRVAVANDYEIVVRGLAAMLSRFPDIEAVDMFLAGDAPPSVDIDIVLFDTFGREGIDNGELSKIVATPGVRRVVLFTLSWAESLTTTALDQGASAVISKGLTGDELVAQLRDVHAGTIVVAPPTHGRVTSGVGRDWPGRSFGLSERESEALVLLAQGLRNLEIAHALYVSEDTVKTHLKRAYRKLGVANRAQATAIALKHPSFSTGTQVVPDIRPQESTLSLTE